MRRRLVMIGCGVLALALLARSVWLTHEANQRDREREEHVLFLEAERVARHLDAWKPQLTPAVLRLLNFQRIQIRILLYDLSGQEVGRPRGTYPALFLNESAARLAWPGLLSPMQGETPLPPHSAESKQELLAGASTRNQLFAANVVGSAWIEAMKSRTGEQWLVATTPVADFDAKAGRAFVSAWLQATVALVEIERPARERWGGWCSARWRWPRGSGASCGCLLGRVIR